MIPRGPHLGALVADLADGQLPPADTERALAHVAICARCAAELEESRAARRAIARSGDVAPDAALTARLLALVHNAPELGRSRSPAGPGVGETRLSGRVLTGELEPRIVTRERAAAIGGLAVLAAAAALFVLGGEPLVAPSTHPGVAQRLLAEAPFESGAQPRSTLVVNASAEVTDLAPVIGDGVLMETAQQHGAVLSWLRAHRWTCPRELPAGFAVTAIQLRESDDSVLELDLARGAQRIVVLEQRGRLDPSGFRDVVPERIRERDVYVLATTPWHLVWESDGTVVTVIAEAPSEVIEGVVASFPARVESTSVPVRISRGWAVVTGAVR